MSELSRLLTFMFKEDRNEIIQQYNDMLDKAEDEEEMLKSFGSPTKLAVTISRSYSRDEMKLTTSIDSKDGTSTETYKVRPVIPEQKPAAAKKPAPAPVQTADDSYVDIIEEIRREKAAEEGIEYKPIFFKEEPAPAVEEEPAEEPEVEETEEAPAEEAAEEAEEAPTEEVSEETEEAPTEEAAEEAEEAPAEEVSEEAEEAPTEEVSEEAEEAPVEEESKETEEAPTEEVSEEAEEAPTEEESEETEEAPTEETVEEAPAEKKLEVQELKLSEVDEIFAQLDAAEPPEVKTEMKTRVFALILYLIVAIPVGLAAALVMLGVELGILLLSLAAFRVGFECLSFTFSGMTVFADIIICLGVTLGVFAIALLLLWLSVWLLIVSIPALCRGLIALGRRLCVKEVEIDG